MNLCKYKNLFGLPNKGIHSYKVFNISIMDVIMTIIGAIILSYIFNVPFIYTVIFLFICGIIAHRLFCVRTTVDKWLFSN